MRELTEAQQSARLAILQDVQRWQGFADWNQLHDRGHHFKQVQACVTRGALMQPGVYRYHLTEAGRAALAQAKE